MKNIIKTCAYLLALCITTGILIPWIVDNDILPAWLDATLVCVLLCVWLCAIHLYLSNPSSWTFCQPEDKDDHKD